MRIDDLQVVLRPRSPWEAMELGMALVRRHARAVWTPWLLLTLPVFALVNAAAWSLQMVPVAALVMWWLKPVFDRCVLYVLSRAVFGATPATRATLAAQRHWGWRPMLHYLSWRRLGPARALYLPVDLLEGGARVGERRRVIGGSVRGVAVMLTVACMHFEAVLAIGAVMSVLMFVPTEFLSESARAVWTLAVQQPPAWAQLGLNALAWLATTLIEPFYVGAGFGLYLNRRTELEAWDVEIAFRRLRRRLQAAAVPVLAAGLLLALPALAGARTTAAAGTPKEPAVVALSEVFGAQYDADAGLRKAVETAYRDPLLNPRERRNEWEPRERKAPEAESANPIAAAIGRIVAVIGEAGLWIALALGAAALAWTAPRWWPRVRELARVPPPPSPLRVEPLVTAEALPADIAGAARALWQGGRLRAALALVYRASVHSMSERTGTALVPGATEAECLRAARALREPDDREAFAHAVRVWQYAAYAQRLPDEAQFEALLARLSQRFGWAA